MTAQESKAIERCLLALLARRAPTSSICPSDVARALGGEGASRDGAGWRALMPAVRQVAFDLQHQGRVVVTRGGSVVRDQADGKGPIRLRRGPAFDAPVPSRQ